MHFVGSKRFFFKSELTTLPDNHGGFWNFYPWNTHGHDVQELLLPVHNTSTDITSEYNYSAFQFVAEMR